MTVLRPQPAEYATQAVSDLSQLYEIGGEILNFIPPEERNAYHYIRAASLGAVAYNLIEHNRRINTVTCDPEVHFYHGISRYNDAFSTAVAIAQRQGCYHLQFPSFMRDHLALATGHSAHEPTPSIVFGLAADYNNFYLRPSDMGAGYGLVWDGDVTLDMIDPHTQAALLPLVDNYL